MRALQMPSKLTGGGDIPRGFDNLRALAERGMMGHALPSPHRIPGRSVLLSGWAFWLWLR
jgi:hypothetical protein